MATVRTFQPTRRSVIVTSFVCASVGLAGCGDPPTANGTKVLEVDTTKDLPADLQKALAGQGGPETHPATFRHPLLDDEGEIRIDFTTVDAPSGGKYITRIDVTVNDAAGYQVSAGAPGNPVNLGTTEAPMHSRMVSVAASKSDWGRSTGGTRTYQVSADGTVKRM